jgi:hypothetical protein
MASHSPNDVKSGDFIPLQLNRSISASTIDSGRKVTIDPSISQSSWCTSIEADLLNVEEFKAKSAQAKYWKNLKDGLKRHVASVKGDVIARKFEIDTTFISR